MHDTKARFALNPFRREKRITSFFWSCCNSKRRRFFLVKASRFGSDKIPYHVRKKEGRFEIRDYQAVPVARTSMNNVGTGNDSFGKLFAFISGNNKRSEKIAMTTPAFIDGPIGAQTSMSFGIPFKTQQPGVPEPTGEAVEISERPPSKVAVLRFPGLMREAAERKAVEELCAWMKTENREADGELTNAYYEAPFIPSPLRRNEAMFRVR